jgi:hypothetical protein
MGKNKGKKKPNRRIKLKLRDVTGFISEIAGIVGLIISLMQCLIGG